MTITFVVSTVAVWAILAAYFVMVRYDRPLPFHWANAIGACILGPISVAAGLYPQATLNAVFGVIGAMGLVRHYRSQP